QKNDPERLERHMLGDINRDGRLDIVIVKNKRGHLLWFKNSGTPRDGKLWPRHVITTDLPGAYDVALADIDADGDLDVAASSWILGNQFAWFENDGTPADGTWTKHMIEADADETRAIRSADFDQDGDVDLFGVIAVLPKKAANGKKQFVPGFVVWYEQFRDNGAVAFRRHDVASPIRPCHGEPADMDGDGDLDILMAVGMSAPVDRTDTHRVEWYENTGKRDALWPIHKVAEGFTDAFEAVAHDLDGDGDMDVVATAWRTPGRVAWFENGGDAKKPWTMHTLKTDWRSANQVIVADFDGDKRPDIAAIAEHGSYELRWWRNEGNK
ncbi:MAG: VCBS repeat-containing protein, partial [bacterium]|nr:VCBS repeat-containing protein [bacterium]